MTYKKSILTLGSIFLLNACTPSEIPVSEGGYYHSRIYFGANLAKSYKKGIRDGCRTSKGEYTKSHWFFKNKQEYVDGWFLGRNKCKGLLKINENGDLIL